MYRHIPKFLPPSNGRDCANRRFGSILPPITVHAPVLLVCIEHAEMFKMTVVRFEVFTAATMKNAVLWDIRP
jgi:hypothetical protein